MAEYGGAVWMDRDSREPLSESDMDGVRSAVDFNYECTRKSLLKDGVELGPYEFKAALVIEAYTTDDLGQRVVIPGRWRHSFGWIASVVEPADV